MVSTALGSPAGMMALLGANLVAQDATFWLNIRTVSIVTIFRHMPRVLQKEGPPVWEGGAGVGSIIGTAKPYRNTPKHWLRK
jgi:hypothetical protein